MSTNEFLLSIGAKYNNNVAQVILRWLLQRGVVVIPKAVRKERMEESFNVFDFELRQEDLDAIKTLDENVSSFLDHRDSATVKCLGEVKFDI